MSDGRKTLAELETVAFAAALGELRRRWSPIPEDRARKALSVAWDAVHRADRLVCTSHHETIKHGGDLGDFVRPHVMRALEQVRTEREARRAKKAARREARKGKR